MPVSAAAGAALLAWYFIKDGEQLSTSTIPKLLLVWIQVQTSRMAG